MPGLYYRSVKKIHVTESEQFNLVDELASLHVLVKSNPIPTESSIERKNRGWLRRSQSFLRQQLTLMSTCFFGDHPVLPGVSMEKISKWQLLESEDISPSQWFPLFRQKVKIGNGKIVEDVFVSRLGNVAMVIPFLPTGEIVVVRQYKHGIGEITIEFPAGRVEHTQTPEMTANAELSQETGLKAGSMEYVGEFFPSPTKDSTRVFGFVAKECVFSEKQNFDETEEIEVVRTNSGELDKWIREGRVVASDTIAIWAKYRLNGNL